MKYLINLYTLQVYINYEMGLTGVTEATKANIQLAIAERLERIVEILESCTKEEK